MRWINLLIFYFSFNLTGLAQKKIALIVTVDNYKYTFPSSAIGWSRTFASSDLVALRDFFKRQKFHVIDTLTETNATREGILNALDQLAMKCEKGGTVVFSFSGHGQQIFDLDDSSKNLSIDEYDGYDEALVPYDAGSLYKEGLYIGEKHIRDEELALKFFRIREAVGKTGSLLVLIDACHSGTITKGPEGEIPYRGNYLAIQPPGYVRPAVRKENTFLMTSTDTELAIAPMVVISGSAQDQPNYPMRIGNTIIGALTYAFIQSVETLQKNINYKTLYASIFSIINQKKSIQTPLIEGEDSLAVLDNNVIQSENFISLTPILNKPDSTHLNVGLMHDVNIGMEFFVFRVDASDQDSNQIVTKGIITRADLFNTAARLDRKIDWEQSYKAKFHSRGVGDFGCNVDIRSKHPGLAELRDSLRRYRNFILTSANPDLIIIDAPGGKQKRAISVIRSIRVDPRYDTIWKKTVDENLALNENDLREILKRIRKFSRAEYLRSLKMPAHDMSFPGLKVNIKPVSAKDGQYNGMFSPIVVDELSMDSMMRGEPYLKLVAIKDRSQTTGYTGLKIEVYNRKVPQAVFLNVLEITPDDNILIRIPHKVRGPSDISYPFNDFKIPGNDSLVGPPVPKILAFQAPLGLGHLKIILTDVPLQLNIIREKKGDLSLDDFLLHAIDESGYENAFNISKKADAIFKPVRANSMKIITLPFVLE